MRGVINYCALVFWFGFVASLPFPEEYLAYQPPHTTLGDGIQRQVQVSQSARTQNGPSNTAYPDFRQQYNNIGYQPRPSFERTAPRNIQYSHVEYPSVANTISNSAYHEMIAQQRQNYENVIRNQKQEEIKEQQVARQNYENMIRNQNQERIKEQQVAELNERLANQLKIQPQVQPHYASSEPLFNTVAEPYLNSVARNNQYQHNYESVNNVASGVPQYFEVNQQQLPIVSSPVQRPFAESNIQSGHNVPIQIEEVNHQVETATLNSQSQHYNQWPDRFRTSPGYNMHDVLSRNPNIKDLLSTTRQKKRYMVIHPNGTVEHVDTLEPIAQRHPNYVLVNAGQISQNYGTPGHYPQPYGTTYPNKLVPPYANLMANTVEPINYTPNNIPPTKFTPVPTAPAASEYVPVSINPEAADTPEFYTATKTTPGPTTPADPLTAPETTPSTLASSTSAPKTTTPTPITPITQAKPASTSSASPAKTDGPATSTTHPDKLTGPTTPATPAKSTAPVIPTTTLASAPKPAVSTKAAVSTDSTESANTSEGPTTPAIPTIGVHSSVNATKPAPASKPANPAEPVTSANSSAPASVTKPATQVTTSKPATSDIPIQSVSTKPTTPATLVSSAKPAPKTSSAPSTTTPVTPSSTAKSADTATITALSTNATPANSTVPVSLKKSPESSPKAVPKASTATAKADSSSNNTSAAAKSSASSTKTAESNKDETAVKKNSLNPLGIDFSKVKSSGKPVMWFRTTDLDVWSKLMSDDEFSVLYLIQVPPQPKIEKDSKTIVFSNGTTIEEITETTWGEDDEPKVTKTIKVINKDDDQQ